MKKHLIIIMLCICATLLFAGCSKSLKTDDQSSEKATKVVFADIGWDSIRLHNAVAMFIAENAYGLEAEEVSGTTPITYTALKNGEISVFMETWSDNLATYKEDLSEGAIKELSLNFGDNAQGFYVPRYIIEGDAERGIEPMAPELKTVEDLKNYSSVFTDPDDPSKGRIYGAISGWEVDKILRNKYTSYGLDEFYNYADPGSDSALAAAIASAYDKGEAIVGYYWEPTWITGKYDLVLLEDAPYDEALYQEGKCACPSVRVTVCANSDFCVKAPEFCEFLSNYETSSALTAEALTFIQDTGATYEEAAVWFLKQHDELISKWLPEEKAELVRSALND